MSERPLRILTVTPQSPLRPGGVERYVYEVCSRLAARGAEVEILCADPSGERPAVEERAGMTIRSVRAWPANSDWCLAPGMWRAISRERWDVIHVQSYHTFVAPLAMLRALTLKTPYCVTFHGGGSSSQLRNRARVLQRRLLRPLLARADALVALARFEIEMYGRELRIPRERFVLIPVGTDLQLAPEAGGGDGGEGGAADGAVLATIGRLERYKGHHRLLAALPEVLRSRPDATALVVGQGPYEPELRAYATELGIADKVEFTSVPPGDHEAMARLLSGVSLVVLMSDYETHPQVALEAAAARRRMLVADDGAGLRELAQDGLALMVAERDSPPAVAAAIVDALAQPAPTARPRLTSWSEVVDQLMELYRRLARTA